MIELKEIQILHVFKFTYGALVIFFAEVLIRKAHSFHLSIFRRDTMIAYDSYNLGVYSIKGDLVLFKNRHYIVKSLLQSVEIFRCLQLSSVRSLAEL